MLLIRIKGMEGVIKLLENLPKSMEKQLPLALKEFAKEVQKSAKLMAPRATGFLASQIKVTQTSPKTITIDTGEAYYALFQEFGFAPHRIPVQYLEMHYSSPGLPAVKIPRGHVSGFITVSRFKPFMQPALYSNLPKLQNILRRRTKQALQKAKGGR